MIKIDKIVGDCNICNIFSRISYNGFFYVCDSCNFELNKNLSEVFRNYNSVFPDETINSLKIGNVNLEENLSYSKFESFEMNNCETIKMLDGYCLLCLQKHDIKRISENIVQFDCEKCGTRYSNIEFLLPEFSKIINSIIMLQSIEEEKNENRENNEIYIDIDEDWNQNCEEGMNNNLPFLLNPPTYSNSEYIQLRTRKFKPHSISCISCSNEYKLIKFDDICYYSCLNCGPVDGNVKFLNVGTYYKTLFSQGDHLNCQFCHKSNIGGEIFTKMFETLSFEEIKFLFIWSSERLRKHPTNPHTGRILDKQAIRGRFAELDKDYFNILYKFCQSEIIPNENYQESLNYFQRSYDTEYENNKEKISECLRISINAKCWSPEMYLEYID